MIKLKPYQRIGVDLMKSRRYVYNADDMGLGKTIQALVAAKESNFDNILVVCPPSVRLSWAEEIKKVGFSNRFILLIDGKDSEWVKGTRHLVIIGYSQLQDINFKRKLLKEYNFDVMILDEAHTLRSHQSQTSQNILGTHGLVHKIPRAWFLSGTPLFNRTMDLYTILKTVAPEIIEPYVDYYAFGKRYCAGKMDKFGNWDFNGSSNTEELRAKLYDSGFMFRREYSDVEGELDTRNVTYHTRSLPLIDTLTDEEIEYLDDLNEPLTSRLKTLASLKVKQSSDAIRVIVGDNTSKAVIVAYHTDALQELAKLLASYNPAVIYGATTKKDREKAFYDFQNDNKCRLIIGQITTIGTGINGLQGACNTMIFSEGDWTPAKIDQAVGRLDRIGQKSSVVNVFMLKATGTLDDLTGGVRRKKQKAISTLHNKKEERKTNMSIEETLNKILETQVKTLEVLNIIGAHYANTSGGDVSVEITSTNPDDDPPPIQLETKAEEKKRLAAEKRAAKKAEKEAGFTTDDILSLLKETLAEARELDSEEATSSAITDIITTYAEKVSLIPDDKVEEIYVKIQDVRRALAENETETPSVSDLLS